MHATANPITEQLDLLHDQWVSFADLPDARLMVWLANDDEAPFAEAFFSKERDPEASETDDLFVELTSPFRRAETHGHALARELTPLCDGERGASATEPESSSSARRFASDEDGIRELLRLLRALRVQLLGENAHAKLAVWLNPKQVSSGSAYLSWLRRLAHEAPEELRFVVLSASAGSDYPSLAKLDPLRVVAQPCALDAKAALTALSQGEGRQTPGDRFRVLQQQLMQAIGARDLESAIALTRAGEELALSQGWPHHAAVLEMMLGAAYTSCEKPRDALKAYAQAERLAAKREAQEREQAAKADSVVVEPACGGALRLSARLAQGAVLLSGRAYKLAAETYVNAIPVAKALNDTRSELDSHRLASFCYSELGEAETAWEIGVRGLKLGLALDDEARKTSSLFYLADHMLRMTKKHGAYRDYRGAVESQLATRLGPNWQEQLLSMQAA